MFEAPTERRRGCRDMALAVALGLLLAAIVILAVT